MRDEIRTIRKRYEDPENGAAPCQMSRDIRRLLQYIDSIEDQLARRIACDAIRAMAQAWEEADHQLLQ